MIQYLESMITQKDELRLYKVIDYWEAIAKQEEDMSHADFDPNFMNRSGIRSSVIREILHDFKAVIGIG